MHQKVSSKKCTGTQQDREQGKGCCAEAGSQAWGIVGIHQSFPCHLRCRQVRTGRSSSHGMQAAVL